MTQPMSDLPPLPRYDYSDYDFDEDEIIETYGVETMREYAKQAVEAERNYWYDEVQYRFGFEVADKIRARSKT